MTINIAVKCPEGIVLGADSLLTVRVGVATAPSAQVPGAKKLFQMGNAPAGVLLNGATAIKGQTIEDIIAEFSETLGGDTATNFDLEVVANELKDFVTGKFKGNEESRLQLIVGGYSRAKAGLRYGELYTIDWPGGAVDNPYSGDAGFGVVIGGQFDPVYRWLFGFDRTTANNLLTPARGDTPDGSWNEQYALTRDYIFQKVEEAGGMVPQEVRDLPIPPWTVVPPWYVLSTYDLARDMNEKGSNIDYDDMLTSVLKKSRFRYEPIFGFFSLAMAVDFTWHMLLLAYVESNFLLKIPVVGSQLGIGIITRDTGFRQVWKKLPTITEAL
jgi:hypothetical protein